MSSFIDKTDYADHIRNGYLDQITQATDSKLDKAESKAIAYMKGFLSSRYDVEQIFNKTGDNRDPIILSLAIDITLFNLHKLINYNKIPKFRVDAYNEAKEWLKGVQALMINPIGLPVPEGPDEGTKDYIVYGSNPKRVNHI
jgi:hypothetical protein